MSLPDTCFLNFRPSASKALVGCIHHCSFRHYNAKIQIRASASKGEALFVEAGSKRRKLRCGLCFEPSFSNTTQLADHLKSHLIKEPPEDEKSCSSPMIGKRHADLFPRRDHVAECPYCGIKAGKQEFYRHIKDGGCPSNYNVQIPVSQKRYVRQHELDNDPRFAPILTERIKGGTLKIRPLHTQHTFEAALVCTEAFEISVDPPRFDLMLSELRWHALNYSIDPSVILRGKVEFHGREYVDPPPVSDVVREAPSVFQLSSLFGGPDWALEKEKNRRKIAESWGVWIWLVADFIPDDSSQLPEVSDSEIVGATALMFHDRLSALEKISLFENPLTPTSLNQDLFLSRRPPESLNYKRAGFIWWTAVLTSFQRRGIAGLLLSGCESVGSSAGFWTFFLQADLQQRDDRAGPLPWPPKLYEAAVGAYKKAGYQEVRKGDEARREEDAYDVKKTCLLMHKTFEGLS